MNTILISLAKQLSELVAKQTATTVNTKLIAIKNEKDINKIRQTYEELLNNLLQERSEAVTIAQSYKAEIEKVEISDEDIEHLHKTVDGLLEIAKGFVKKDDKQSNKDVKDEITAFEQVKSLITVDTLKTMQLLGFNYKKAIGEPLTIMLRNFLLSYAPKIDDLKDVKDIMSPAMADVLKSKNGYDNLTRLLGQKSLNNN